MTLPANIRVNVGAPFPSRVIGDAFIAISKANGIWTIEPDYALLATTPGLTATQVIAVYDPATGVFQTINATALVGLASNVYREITAAGDVVVQPTDIVLLLNKDVGAPTNIQLPQSATRFGIPITVKDLKYDSNTNNITFVPASGETIDGFDAADAAANGVAVIDIDGSSKTLYPLATGGWYWR